MTATSIVTQPDSLKDKIHRFLCSEVTDKTLAFFWAIIGFKILFNAVQAKQGLPLILLVAQSISHNVFLLVRRQPYRITLNPLYWMVAFVGAHWGYVYGIWNDPNATAIVPTWVTYAFSLIGAVIFVWSRISIGRNFGMVPAEREIVTNGAYQYVRHPIYTSSFILGLGHHLNHFSFQVFLIWSLGLCIMVTKSLMEEKFLASNSYYQEYKARVKYRFLPFIV